MRVQLERWSESAAALRIAIELGSEKSKPILAQLQAQYPHLTAKETAAWVTHWEIGWRCFSGDNSAGSIAALEKALAAGAPDNMSW